MTETLVESAAGKTLVARPPLAPSVTIYLHGGPLDGQSRQWRLQTRYITQTIEQNETEWWQIFYVYRPCPPGCSNFYLAEIVRLHCDDTRQ